MTTRCVCHTLFAYAVRIGAIATAGRGDRGDRRGVLAYSLPPYLTGGTQVPSTFGLHYPLLVAHVLLASVAMVCAVAQIWPGLRHRHPALHRRTGRVYVATAIPAAVCAW